MLTSVTTRSGPSTSRNVFDLVKVHVRRKRRGARAWIIHRLDKEASGLLVFAKSERAFAILKNQFRTKDAHRIYYAVGEGLVGPDASHGTIQSHLRQNQRGLMESVPVGEVARLSRDVDLSEGGDDEGPAQQPRLAVTHYRVAATGKGRTLFQLRLETGRKNQIRVHLRDLGHPICGDQRYRALQSDGVAPPPMERDAIDHDLRVCLHAAELGFEHPGTGANVRYRSPVPAMFYKLVGQKPPPGSAPDEADQAQVEQAASDLVPGGPVRENAKPTARVEREPARNPDGLPERRDPESSWEHVAGWYTGLVEERGSDHHERVVIPGTLKLLGDAVGAGARILDIACGTGVLSRALAERGARVLGVDSAPGLIQAARGAGIPGGGGFIEYQVHDARLLETIDAPAFEGELFDGAACVLALMNIDPLGPLLTSCAARLKPGAPLVAVILHPAFRNPGRTGWGWEKEGQAGPPAGDQRGTRRASSRPSSRPTRFEPRPEIHQYRRVDAYLSEGKAPIVMNPGAVSSGAKPVTTWTYHRPIGAYVAALASAGFAVDSMEEWASQRKSQPGPRAAEENRARAEIPMFLALRARKLG
jgi:23S rRNA-/tRNA-specific pseudouridylate synthase/SAM-dependent methyltransferase